MLGTIMLGQILGEVQNWICHVSCVSMGCNMCGVAILICEKLHDKRKKKMHANMMP
jgi:hypothetical protein